MIENEPERLKSESRIRRKPRTYAQQKSRLDVYTYELLTLSAEGRSSSELQTWLAKKRIDVDRSTINSWLRRKRDDG